MDLLLNKFKSFLGLRTDNELHSSNTDRYGQTANKPQQFNDDIDSFFETPNNNHGIRQFNVFTSPLEMQQYFEQQMHEMMKQFGFFHSQGFGADNSIFSAVNDDDDCQSLTAPPSARSDLRDQFLKPGYEERASEDDNNKRDKSDTDIDGMLNASHLQPFFPSDDENKAINSYNPKKKGPNYQFYGQSVNVKTIIKSDGSSEIHRTVRDHEGNEETTITRKTGNQEYTVTKHRDREGNEKVVENLVNLDEKDLGKFLTSPNNENNSLGWLFDKFFQ